MESCILLHSLVLAISRAMRLVALSSFARRRLPSGDAGARKSLAWHCHSDRTRQTSCFRSHVCLFVLAKHFQFYSLVDILIGGNHRTRREKNTQNSDDVGGTRRLLLLFSEKAFSTYRLRRSTLPLTSNRWHDFSSLLETMERDIRHIH